MHHGELAERNRVAIERFRRWYRADGAATLTIGGRVRVLRRLGRWLELKHDVALVDARRKQLQDWKDSLEVSPRCLAGYVSGLHVFYGQWLWEVERYRKNNPSALVKRPRRTGKPLVTPVSEPDTFLALEAAQGDSELFAWIMLMRYCGLRRKEIAELRVENIAERPGGGLWLAIHGKGDKWRRVPAAPEVAACLAAFRRGTGPLFTTQRRKAYQPDDVGWRVNTHLKRLDIHHVGHHLRHSFATRTLEVDPNIRRLQEAMGHETLAATVVYTHVEPNDVAAAVDLMTAESHSLRRREALRLVREA